MIDNATYMMLTTFCKHILNGYVLIGVLGKFILILNSVNKHYGFVV